MGHDKREKIADKEKIVTETDVLGCRPVVLCKPPSHLFR